MHGATTYEHHQRCPSPLRRPAPLLDRRAGAGRPRLARASRPPAGKQPASRRILVIRSTCRIGNNLFLLPFCKRCAAPTPCRDRAGVQRRSAAPFPPICNCSAFIRSSCRANGCWPLSVLWRLRRQHYDRVYVPFASSTDHLIAGWVKAREKLGFDDAKGDALFPSPLTPNQHCHYAHQPLQLLGMHGHLADQIELGSLLHSASPRLLALRHDYPARPLIGFFHRGPQGQGALSAPVATTARGSAPPLPQRPADPARGSRRSPAPARGRAGVLASLSELARFAGGLPLRQR
ncbi:hypothetical protein H2136_22240 [Aeromonas hydrophila]|uniref:Uncharacterized protein n=1 Tax=Aeromonas hydrophila TaxID=644 RepID=A0A926FPC0_AERHY|nr:hypothetical protein [Aeromonas hydrophila]